MGMRKRGTLVSIFHHLSSGVFACFSCSCRFFSSLSFHKKAPEFFECPFFPSESFCHLVFFFLLLLLSIADQIFALSSFLAYGRTNTAPLSSLFLFRTRSIDDQKRRGGEEKGKREMTSRPNKSSGRNHKFNFINIFFARKINSALFSHNCKFSRLIQKSISLSLFVEKTHTDLSLYSTHNKLP